MRVVGGRVLVAAFTTLCLLLIIGWSSGSVELSYILRFYVTADNRQRATQSARVKYTKSKCYFTINIHKIKNILLTGWQQWRLTGLEGTLSRLSRWALNLFFAFVSIYLELNKDYCLHNPPLWQLSDVQTWSCQGSSGGAEELKLASNKSSLFSSSFPRWLDHPGLCHMDTLANPIQVPAVSDFPFNVNFMDLVTQLTFWH